MQRRWRQSSVGAESCLHQVSPYIGKLKSSIAASLISTFTAPNDVVIDPFSGSGAVPLEALSLGRHVIASDISDYAAVLTRAKMNPPRTPEDAVLTAKSFVLRAKERAASTRYRVQAPTWVRSFFHPRTLRETKILCDLLREEKQWFLLACVLGILHHQRPGFLSYPSSHLVPYLRDKKFPKAKFPELYKYRDVEPRLYAKIKRAYRRFPVLSGHLRCQFLQEDARKIKVRRKADAVITSPPYMNALDYGRDNRLRLWFLNSADYREIDSLNRATVPAFSELMNEFALRCYENTKASGVMVLVVGEVRRKARTVETHEVVKNAIEASRKWRFANQTVDTVPDVRRSRRDCRGTKREWIMVFKKRRSL
jgi:hypothetical protein